jgi:transposase
MAKKRQQKKRKSVKMLHQIQPDAAGIDVGATEIYVAVPDGRTSEPVRCFGTFTRDLHEVAQWLQSCNIKSVVMESTGVYWIPILQILESYDFEVLLVNARHVKNVPGRKTDVQDCQWLQYLHSVGLLRGSYRPSQDVCAIRSLLRHRESMVKISSTHVQHMQKALTQMNLQIHNVISDITGLTGQAIVDAILAGERNPKKLALLKHGRIKASKSVIEKSLEGNYLPEHLFTLRQALQSYRHYRQMIIACDQEIEAYLTDFEARIDPDENPPPTPRVKGTKPKGNEPDFDLRSHLYRLFGTDLTQVDGINVLTAQSLFAEIGPNLSKFPSVHHFCSWLGLCPNNKISGGRILAAKTRPGSNRAAQSLRLAAHALWRSQSYLGHYYRRMRARHGAPKAITATAHKLARIVFHLINTGKAYDESVFAMQENLHKQRMERNLKKQAKRLGFQLVPCQ